MTLNPTSQIETIDGVERIDGKRICSRCIYDESVPSIRFDENGVCNYCHMVDNLVDEYKTGSPEGEAKFQEIVAAIKKDGYREKI